VTGSSLPQAVSTLKRSGLVAVVTRVPSDRPGGRILSQRPAAGAKLARGSRVRLGVSVQRTIAVPDVTGVQGLAAVHTLERDHLVASLRYVPSTQPARRIVSQWPRAGTSVKPGTSVRLNVSQGVRAAPAKTTVPDVTGEDEQTATADLQAAGLTVESVDSATDDPAEDGTVLRQSPSSDRQVAKGSTVTIHVGRS
jgi:serine/threonine-protein kinase